MNMKWFKLSKVKFPNIKKIFRVKNKLRATLIGTLMTVTVGYASLNSSLGIEGLISILQNADFNVFFSKTIVDGVDKMSLIDAGSQSITFTSSDISSENPSVIDYTITNASRQYNAEVSIKCDPETSNGISLTYNKASSMVEANDSLSGTITTAITGEGDTTSTDRLERLVDIIRKQSKGSDTTNNINYSDISSSQNGNGVYTTNNTDSGNSIYFFRGNVNNNVVFAEKCWKMVRTTEIDGVKLIYNGEYLNGRCNGNNPVIESGVSYGSSFNYETSEFKKRIEDWYEKNLGGTTYDEYVVNDSYCNDSKNSSYSGKPILKCTNRINSRIAAITADEIVFAGGISGAKTETIGTPKQNMSFYLYSPTISWTMTYDSILYLGAIKASSTYDGVYSTADHQGEYGMSIRPVLSVRGDTRVRTGDGTASKPYVLESDKYDKFTCTININKVEQSGGGSGGGGYQKLYDYVKGESLGEDVSRKIDYDKVSSDTNGKGVYSTTDTDSGKDVFFYRGNIETNNVVFAEKCWKILRTTETSGTKLVYNGEKTADGTCENTGANASIGDSAWHTVAGKTIYKDSAVKGVVDSWWETNIKGTDYEKLVEDTVYCNDNSVASSTSNIYSPNSSATYYAGASRVGAVARVTSPTLKCAQVSDRLTVASGALKYPIAMLSADEVVYAGATGGISAGKKTNAENYNFYLYTGEKNTWVLTPQRSQTNLYIVHVLGNQGAIANEVSTGSIFVRPVISLVNSVKILRGIGTERNPYIVGEVTEQEVPTSKVPDAWQDNGMFSSYYNQAYDKLQTMSLDEKIGQLLVVRYVEKTAADAINNYHVGGFTFYKVDFDNKTKAQVINMTSSLQNQAKIPLLLAADEEGGTVVRVSSNPNLASEPFKSPKEVYDSGGLAAIKKDTINKSAMLYELGINLNYAPVVDIASPGSYIYKRTLGQDTETTSDFASTVIKASKSSGVSYTLKHFPGYGNNADTHTSSSVDETSVDELWNKHLLPFAAGVNAGAESVMTSHNIVSAVDKENPSSLSKKVHDILINDLKFTGIIITDDLDMDATKNVDNKYVKTIQAGSNIILHGDYKAAHNEIKTAVTNGTLTEDEVSRMAFKVLAWKYFKGILKD